jgi:hypothetical protein
MNTELQKQYEDKIAAIELLQAYQAGISAGELNPFWESYFKKRLEILGSQI